MAYEKLPVFNSAWLLSNGQAPPASRTGGSSTPSDRAALLDRVRKYLLATPGAVEGEGGDNATFQLCCRIVRGFGLEPSEALPLLHEWNQKCVPPWTECELQQKVENAARYGTEPTGGRRDAPDSLRVVSSDERAPRSSSTDFHLTDAGNAEFFAALWRDRVRFNHRQGRWLVWHGHRWMPDADAEVERLALTAVRQRQAAALTIDDADHKKRAMRWALGSESRWRLDAMLALAKAVKPIADPGKDWDCDPWLLGVPNGVVDLRTGMLRPGSPDDRITMTTAVPYVPDADAPRWRSFLHDVFAADVPLIGYVHRSVGYSLTGITTEQILFMEYGVGSNGKGTFTNSIRRTLGDYGHTMPFSTVELYRRSDIPNDVAALVGKRFVVASETREDARLNEARIKALTGCDPISARFMRQEWFEFEPVAKFWLSVNHRPIVRDDSHGFWRRIRLIPFTRTFSVDPRFADSLMKEAVGILAWAVQGCLLWQAEGLTAPDSVMTATEIYRAEFDPLAEFIGTACDVVQALQISATEFYGHYKLWAERRGLTERERLTITAFGRKMGERFEKRTTRKGIVYLGITRKSLNADQEDGCSESQADERGEG